MHVPKRRRYVKDKMQSRKSLPPFRRKTRQLSLVSPSTASIVIYLSFGRLLRKRVQHFLELHGERSDEDNALAIHKFRNGGCRILIASYGCGCEMLDFPNANHVILFGHSLNPIHRFQGVGRVDRLVQKKQVYVYPVYVINSVEGYLNQLYCRKLDMATDLSVYMKKDEQNF